MEQICQDAGFPDAIPGLEITWARRYPHPEDGPQEDGRYTVHNFWFSFRLGSEIIIYTKEGESNRRFLVDRRPHLERFNRLCNTMIASQGWSYKAETRALETLSTLVDPDRYEDYILTGGFCEPSEQSRVVYWFRRLRPTIAIGPHGPLCCLCLHPIAYYDRTFAGALCPTDEVIAHLTLMRGDERRYWGRSQQHPLSHPSSGI